MRILWILVLSLGYIGWAQHPTADQVLQTLREYDRAFLKQYDFTATVERRGFFTSERLIHRLRATADSERQVAVVVHDQLRHLRYPDYAVLRDRDRFLIISLLGDIPYGNKVPYLYCRERAYLEEKERFIEAEWLQCVYIAPDNRVASTLPPKREPLIALLRSRNCPSTTWRDYAFLALGRGFSQCLERAVSVHQLANGNLALEAIEGEGIIWRLVIAPSQRYLVVEAEKIVEGRRRERYMCEGIISSEIPLGKQGVQIFYSSSGEETARFVCERFEPCFDFGWYEQVRQRVRRPPSGTEILDGRTEPFTVFRLR